MKTTIVHNGSADYRRTAEHGQDRVRRRQDGVYEFVYHNIKNLGFDESNVHVHVSNGGHSDIVAIEWEIELVYKYQAEDTLGTSTACSKTRTGTTSEAMDVFPRPSSGPPSGNC